MTMKKMSRMKKRMSMMFSRIWGICATYCPNGRDDTGWGEWGQMKKKRNGHVMTVIYFHEIEDYCA